MKTKLFILAIGLLVTGCEGGGGAGSSSASIQTTQSGGSGGASPSPSPSASISPSPSPSPSASPSPGSITVTSFTPASSAATATGNIVVTGTNFTAGSQILIGGSGCSTTFNSSTQLTCGVPNHALGDVSIAVQTAGVTVTASNSFKYVNITQIQDNCVLLSDGTVNCWDRTNGGAAFAIMDPSGVGQLKNVIQISSSSNIHFSEATYGTDMGCAVLSSGQVACWGNNEGNIRGNPSVPSALSTSPQASYVLNTSGSGNLTGAVAVFVNGSIGVACAIVGASRNVDCWGSGSNIESQGYTYPAPVYAAASTLLSNVYGIVMNQTQACYVVGNYYPAGAGTIYCQGDTWSKASSYQYPTASTFWTGIEDSGDNLVTSSLQDTPGTANSIAGNQDGGTEFCWGRADATYANQGIYLNRADEDCIGLSPTVSYYYVPGEPASYVDSDPLNYGLALIQEDSLQSGTDTLITQEWLTRQSHCRIHGGQIECMGSGEIGNGVNYGLESAIQSSNYPDVTFPAVSPGYEIVQNPTGGTALAGVSQITTGMALLSTGSLMAFGNWTVGLGINSSGQTIGGQTYGGLTSQAVPMTIWQ